MADLNDLPAGPSTNVATSSVSSSTELATFGAGCFWGVELAFSRLEGVKATAVGYAGGGPEYPDPSYRQVCSGHTGHAEVVRVEYDPRIVGYKQLLELFWSSHDMTQLNRQGPDRGTQYRSVILYHDNQQQEAARVSRDSVQKRLGTRRTVVTEIVPATTFYPAEQYHQKYLEKQGLATCHI